MFNHHKRHKDLPLAFFQIDRGGPLRDEALIYERVLRNICDVKTKVYMYPGFPYSPWGFFKFLKSSEKFRAEQVEGMSWLLGRTPDFSKVVTSAKADTI